MAEGLNKVMLFGALGADPELKALPSGQFLLKMRLATTERYKDRSEQWTERTEWHSCNVWGKRAEALSRFLKKGDRLLIEGSLRTSSYDKDGQKHYRTEIQASNVYLSGNGGGRGRADEDAEAPRRMPSAGGSSGGVAPPDFDDFPSGDDDIPF